MPLSAQHILITGAGGGLGATAALALAAKGAHIILLDKRISAMEKTYDAIVNAGGPEPIMYPFDLAGASESDYETLAETIANQYGALQGLLHSAVEFSAYTPLATHKTHDWGHAFNVNLHAPFLLTRVLLPVLQRSAQASVVFTSDSSARLSPAYGGAYAVSKVAMEALATVLAQELAAEAVVRVNTLVPGPVDSPLRKKAYPAEDKRQVPTMAQLAPAYVYCFSDASIGVTGQVLDARQWMHA